MKSAKRKPKERLNRLYEALAIENRIGNRLARRSVVVRIKKQLARKRTPTQGRRLKYSDPPQAVSRNIQKFKPMNNDTTTAARKPIAIALISSPVRFSR
ncbi:MAG: hypothetical protein H6751_00550 [Candidatus Omnitrophica bacterium]|nr:hypothetical protein [Candidatus Omnitrophota bacterium]